MPPHQYHNYSCPFTGGGGDIVYTIKPGYLIIWYEGGIILDEFNGDANDTNVYGIKYGIVRHTFSQTGTQDGLVVTTTGNLLNLSIGSVKVYAWHNVSKAWKSVYPNTNKEVNGWIDIGRFRLENRSKSDTARNRSAVEYLERKAESFMVEEFKPKYRNFVKLLRRRNRSYREHFDVHGHEFDTSLFAEMNDGLLSHVAAFIGNDNQYQENRVRNLSTLYQFTKLLSDRFI